MATNHQFEPVEDTPAWAAELMEGMAKASTIDVVHAQAEVQLTITLATENPPDVWEEWAQSELTPMWMRSAIIEYAASESRWQQVRQLAELELVDELLGDMVQAGDEDEE